MYTYFLYEIDKFNTTDMKRRAEIQRMVIDARRERRADRQLSAHPFRHLLTGSRR